MPGVSVRKSSPKKLLEIAHFVRAADDAGAAGVARERREPDRVLPGPPCKPSSLRSSARDAREQRHREDVRRRDAELAPRARCAASTAARIISRPPSA